MKYIQQAIDVLTNPGDPNDQSIKDFERDVLKRYYNENILAHEEYIEKGVYDSIPEMAEFKAEMETIERLLAWKNTH